MSLLPRIVLLAAIVCPDACRAAQPSAKAVRAAGPIRLDGRLDEPAWADARWQTGFVLANGPESEPLKPAAVQTRFKVLFDDHAVYVAVECDEPRIENLKAKTPWRDGAVWADDCVEIFFDPSNDGRYYHQVMVNSRGVIYDSYSADYGLVHNRLWNGAFRAAGHVDRAARKWSVEVEIPFGAIVLGERAGGTWLWNVTRERHAGGKLELTSWARLRRNFHQPKQFGKLTGLPADYSAFRFRVGEPRVTVSRAASGLATLSLALRARNETGADRRVAAAASVFGDERNRVEAGPALARRNEEVTFNFPALRLRGSTARTNVVFEIRDAQTKRLLKAVVKSLATEYRPIAVRVLRPCYRNNIYATQRLKEIVFEVELSAQVRQACAGVTYALVDERGEALARGRAPASKIAAPIRLDAAGLKVGKYTLKVAAVAANDEPKARAAVTLRKLPPPPSGNEVRIDEHRNVLVNGKPLFAIGWYGGVPVRDPRADVVALQNITTPAVVKPSDLSAQRRLFEKHGVYSIVSVENGRLFHSFRLWQKRNQAFRSITTELHTRTEPSEKMKQLVKRLVDAVRGEPWLLGYYIADEPEIHNIPSAYLENYYRYLRELDPYHPVFVTNDTIDGIVTHGYKCADVLDPDPYNPDWDYVPNFLKKVNEVASLGKATYVTLWHAVGQTHFTREMGSAPPYPYRVFRNQYFASIAYGAKGFTAYTAAFFLPEVEYRYGLPYVWRELRFLEKAILSPAPREPLVVEGAADLATWARQVDGRVYIILVNHKPGPRAATVRWKPLASRSSLIVMSEGRTVRVRNAAFRDRFEPGDVHVYTDDPRARDFPTVQSILAELARRKREAIKPGNLLHWTRGTKVRCSKGYFAPWFHQYFYYAINGVTDDVGWSAYAWNRKSAWIEFTLKQPARIGRVVIYTPNLRDYQLDFIAADGQAHRVRVAGNEQSVVTHNFRPAIPCLKLRLTATAVRPCDLPHGNAPLVSEIEAYAEPGPGPVTRVEKVAAAGQRDVKALFTDRGEPVALWIEDFKPFQTAPLYFWNGRDTKWVLDPKQLRAEPRPEGGVTVCSISRRGYAGMTHFFPYDPKFRFFQVKLSRIEGKGYRFTSVGFGSGSGKPGYRRAVNTARPGLYTVDTHYVHDSFRTGRTKKCFISVFAAGARKLPDGAVRPGPRFSFDWLRLVRRPVDGLAVTLANGAPLPEAVKAGDTLHFELHLEHSAQDAVVEVLVGPSYKPFALNGQPYVQLTRADAAGRVWVGEIALGPGAGKFKSKGYPPVFKASIVGGRIAETYASAFVEFK